MMKPILVETMKESPGKCDCDLTYTEQGDCALGADVVFFATCKLGGSNVVGREAGHADPQDLEYWAYQDLIEQYKYPMLIDGACNAHVISAILSASIHHS